MIKAALAMLGGPEGLKKLISGGLADAEPALIEELTEGENKALVFQVIQIGEEQRLAVCLQPIHQQGEEQLLKKPLKTLSLEGFILEIIDKIK